MYENRMQLADQHDGVSSPVRGAPFMASERGMPVEWGVVPQTGVWFVLGLLIQTQIFRSPLTYSISDV